MGTPQHQSSCSLVIDREAHQVIVDGQPVHLTNAEYTLLTTLANSPRRAFSSEHLTQVLTHSEWIAQTHGLHVTVSRLRRKLGESGTRPRRVVTVHGYGYRYDPDPIPDLAAAMTPTAQPDPLYPSTQPGYIVVALDRTILWASDAFAQLLGWKPTDVQGTTLYELNHPDDRPHAMPAREELDSGLSAAFLFHLRTASGGYRLFEALARPIVDPSGKTIVFVGEYRPHTATKEISLLDPHPVSANSSISRDQR